MNKVNEIKCNCVEEMVNVLTRMLENHETSWTKGWSVKNGSFRNYVSNKEYNGGTNIMSLWISTMIMPEILGQQRSYYYVTSKQAFELGWKLKSECKTWSKDNEARRKEIETLYVEKTLTVDEVEKQKIQDKIDELKYQIRTHTIWEDIVFYVMKYYTIIERDGVWYRQDLVYKNGEYVIVKEREVDEKYVQYHQYAVNKVDTEISTRFYTVAPIEFFEGEKRIKNRETEVQNYGTQKTFNELWNTLYDYCKKHKITVKEVESNNAYYSLVNDSIHLPLITQFKSEAEALDVFAHEATHSTGHESRLKRNLDGNYGSEKYSKEELVAEIGSLFFMLESGKLTDEILENKLAYIKGYLKKIRTDNLTNNLIYGINNGRKAFEYIIEADEDFGGDYE